VSRETIFEETETVTLKTEGDTPALEFLGFDLEKTNPAPGETVSFETVVQANADNIFYVVVTRDPGTAREEEIFDLAHLDLVPGEEMPISQSVTAPESVEEMTLHVEGGYEA
jgi:hypothetical protein